MHKKSITVLFLAGLLFNTYTTSSFDQYFPFYMLVNYPKITVTTASALFSGICWKNREQLSKWHALGCVSNACTFAYLFYEVAKNAPQDTKGQTILPRDYSAEKTQLINTTLGSTPKEQLSNLTTALFVVGAQAIVNVYLCLDAMWQKQTKETEKSKGIPHA